MSLGVLQQIFDSLADGSEAAGCNAVTSADSGALQRKPAPLLACTPVTPVTSQSGDAEAQHVQAPQTCADCRHLTRVKTCTAPVEAGLLTAAEGYGIAWPPPGRGATCQAWTPAARTGSQPSEALACAINRVCDVRGDDAANRAGLLAECAALSPEGQADILAHFTIEAARWEGKP